MRLQLFTTVRMCDGSGGRLAAKSEVLVRDMVLHYPLDADAMLHLVPGRMLFGAYVVREVSLLRLDSQGVVDIGVVGFQEPDRESLKKRIRHLLADGWHLRDPRRDAEMRL